jgi:hypothetical protein
MIDLPDQLENAIQNVDSAALTHRIQPLALDLLDASSHFPKGMDVYWLSQFLSCFGEMEIVSILKRIVNVMGENSRVYVLETCWDRQQHEAAAYSLINTSLYFTCMASGNSKMYHSNELVECFVAAGLQVTNIIEDLGVCHTLFECRKEQGS